MSATIPDSIRRQVNAASALIARIIENDLVAVHLYGSAVEGGLKAPKRYRFTGYH